jgi:hypothetical protein
MFTVLFKAAKDNQIRILVKEGKLSTAEANKLFEIDADPWAERKPLNKTLESAKAT